MSDVSKYIEIVEIGESASGLTKIYSVRNTRTNIEAGQIRWYGGWRKYAFYPTIEDQDWIAFDAECLYMVANFIGDRMIERHG